MVRSVKPAGDERTPDGAEYAAERPPREQLLNIRSEDRDDALILFIDGEIDGLTAPRMRAAIGAAFERLTGRMLVLDLTEVRFLGSAGLRTLLDSAAEAVTHHGHQPLRVVVDENRPVVRPIEIVGLDNVLALYHSVGDALAA
jgi:anti-sigma B factor antagonist